MPLTNLGALHIDVTVETLQFLVIFMLESVDIMIDRLKEYCRRLSISLRRRP
ncbi:hypothetical protein DOTSEDRAFT_46755 [Dothistroma septosporum NZE10]|uniref:Uncharacterized protein n=1 Tax=Dothistroma septosporum (strain NZE10 / CBS 128990) TaxID=675120 RepID=N1PIB6_DOTSN|nr:hypothetical protein DOTSEDRAFT_46755 [Dothistroma septosporum NZE10]